MIGNELSDLLPLTAAKTRALLPRDALGRLVSIGAVIRWATKGCGGRRLRAVRIGSRYYVSPSELRAFAAPAGIDAQAEIRPSSGERQEAPREAVARLRQIQSADAALTAAGV